jgi:hypothetical protein
MTSREYSIPASWKRIFVFVIVGSSPTIQEISDNLRYLSVAKLIPNIPCRRD